MNYDDERDGAEAYNERDYLSHPDCRDPEHPGCEDCQDADESWRTPGTLHSESIE